jgi:hypothetical protein
MTSTVLNLDKDNSHILGQISQQEEELFMQAWKADPDIIKNHNYEDKSKIYLSLAIIHMLELSTNPTIFEKFFRARNPEFYITEIYKI